MERAKAKGVCEETRRRGDEEVVLCSVGGACGSSGGAGEETVTANGKAGGGWTGGHSHMGWSWLSWLYRILDVRFLVEVECKRRRQEACALVRSNDCKPRDAIPIISRCPETDNCVPPTVMRM